MKNRRHTQELKCKVTCCANPNRRVGYLAWSAHTLHGVLYLLDCDVLKKFHRTIPFPLLFHEVELHGSSKVILKPNKAVLPFGNSSDSGTQLVTSIVMVIVMISIMKQDIITDYIT